MRKTIISFIITFILIPITHAQIPDTARQNNSLEKGRWALQFGIGNEFSFNLKAFGDIFILAKYHLGNKHALRSGVGFTIQKNQHDYNILLGYMFYLKSKSNVGLYLSLEAGGRYYFIQTTTIQEDKETRSYIASVSGIGGVEYFVNKDLSFFGEYVATLDYTKTIEEDFSSLLLHEEEGKKTVTKNLSLNAKKTRLGISIYF